MKKEYLSTGALRAIIELTDPSNPLSKTITPGELLQSVKEALALEQSAKRFTITGFGSCQFSIDDIINWLPQNTRLHQWLETAAIGASLTCPVEVGKETFTRTV